MAGEYMTAATPTLRDLQQQPSQTFAKVQEEIWQTVASKDANTPVDLYKGSCVYAPLTESTKIGEPSGNPRDGQALRFVIFNPASYVVNWHAKFRFAGAAGPVVTVTNHWTSVKFVYRADLDLWFETARALNL